MPVTFIVKVGQLPLAEAELSAFGAKYNDGEELLLPRCLEPDGSLSPVPSNGMVPLDCKLLFEDVPETGTLLPLANATAAVSLHRLTLDPATHGGVYLVDFGLPPLVISASISEGVAGCACEKCGGTGITW